jgi:arylsulfatase A-like enzyme/Tfp pilus assembly protein PilF
MPRPLLLAGILLLFSCHHPEPKAIAPPPVILISIDTLRSDHLPPYGYRDIATPAIDQLARDGIVFERAFSHVPLTLPSHTSIFTGLLPAHHGVRDNAGFVLDPKTPTIASLLRAHGYATGGAVSAYVLRATTNINSGFESYDDGIAFIEGAPTGNLARAGRETVAIAERWMAAQTAARPFFSFVHLFEPHAPYEPTYDGEIVTADALVGELLDSLRASGRYDDALIVLLSDHGEGLREHGEQEHGVLLYREALQVPLIVKLPRNERRGTRVAQPVQLVDVLPTIAAVTGIPAPPTDGHSLLAPSPARDLYAETLYPRIHLGWSDLRSVIAWPHHLIDGPKPELYDLTRDHTEQHNLRDTQRRVYTTLQHDLTLAPAAPAAAARIAPEEARKLAALGYVSGQSSAAPSTLNPRDHLHDLDALKRTTELMAAHKDAEAAQLMETLLARNPAWSDLRGDLGLAYEHLTDWPRAEKTYRDAIRTTPELAPEFALSLANVLLQRHALDDAAAHARLALPHNPSGAHEILSRIAFTRGQLSEAQREAELAKNDLLLARIHLAQNNAPAALIALQRIYTTTQTTHTPLPRGYFTLAGEVFLHLGRREEARLSFEHALELHPDDREARARLQTLRTSPPPTHGGL